MKKIKAIILSVLMSISGMALAIEPVNVWIIHSGGAVETTCRAAWDSYSETYNQPVVYIVKDGANGALGLQDMIDSKKTYKFACIGSSHVIYNKFVMPEGNKIDQIKGVFQSVVFPTVWYTPNSNTAKDIKELVAQFKELDRPINVGVVAPVHIATAHYLSEKYNIRINIVPYKKVPQLFPSLADGSLDLAFESGTGISVAESGKFRVFGYSASSPIPKLSPFSDLTKQDPGLRNLNSWAGFAVTKNTPKTDYSGMMKNMYKVVHSTEFGKVANSVNSVPTGVTEEGLATIIANETATVARLWK